MISVYADSARSENEDSSAYLTSLTVVRNTASEEVSAYASRSRLMSFFRFVNVRIASYRTPLQFGLQTSDAKDIMSINMSSGKYMSKDDVVCNIPCRDIS